MWLGRSIRYARSFPTRLKCVERAGIPAWEHAGAWGQQRLFAGRGGDVFDDDNNNEPRLTTRGKTYAADEIDFFDVLDGADFDDNDDEEDDEEQEARRQQQARDELDERKGRGWSDPWEITDEDFMQRRVLDDLPDWTPGLCSRVSLERVKIHPDGIPTLDKLAKLALPPPPAPHPALGGAKEYAKQRKIYLHGIVYDKVVAVAKPRIPAILKLATWDDKQNAIDELYETVESELKDQEDILGRNPNFGTWVETALEKYLNTMNAEIQKTDDDTAKITSGIDGEVDKGFGSEDEGIVADGTKAVEEDAVVDDANADPIFMDLFNKEDGAEAIVPKILHPLKPHARDGPGRMVEEWELSAHKETKRILLRQCTRQIARALNDNISSRVYVHGRNGVGKSSALSAIVGSARKSAYIVLYLNEGDRLRRDGKYIEPNLKRKGIFDLPVLAQEISEQLLFNHKSDLEGMVAKKETMEMLFTQDQLKRLHSEDERKEEFALVDLLETAMEKKSLSSMCFATVVHTLMDQDEKPFLMVLDDFNGYYDNGYYFHMEYDEMVRNAIPYSQISLFKPALDAMGISLGETSSPNAVIKRGGIVVGTTESHAVAKKFTDALTASALEAEKPSPGDAPMYVVEVPRYSLKETEHVISNMEATGIGRLRFDRGDTVMNKNEMGYLRMVSGSVAQKLLDNCII